MISNSIPYASPQLPAPQGVLVPAGGRRMVAFIDDLHMLAPAASGLMPPLELLKLWADHGIWCAPHRSAQRGPPAAPGLVRDSQRCVRRAGTTRTRATRWPSKTSSCWPQ